MTVLGRLVGVGRDPAPRRSGDMSGFIPPPGAEIIGGSSVGGAVSEEKALRHSAVWACVDIRAGLMSSFPVHSYRGRGAARRRVDPTPLILEKPGSDWTMAEFLWGAECSLLLRGNAYARIIRDKDLVPQQVEPLHPDEVRTERRMNGSVQWVVGDKPVDRSDLWVARRHRQFGSLHGMSAIAYARQSIVLGLEAERFGASFFMDGAHPTALLKSSSSLTEEQAMLAKKRFIAAVGNKREPAVLGGDWSYDAIQVSPEDSQFLDAIGANATTISRFMGVPAELIGAGATGTKSLDYTNRESRASDFLVYHVNAGVVGIQDALDTLTPRGQYTKLGFDGMLAPDLKAQAEVEKIRLEMGITNPDEVREKHDMPPLPDGQGKTYNWPPRASVTPTSAI